ncbi:chemotaxis protein CheX [Pseudothermotoga thermarum]|uniref:CheC domain protein n=1 Tax=Pseudothermotoga thermarum DSM 5069 TaxID=688269 RepID=F7YV75_9THEM|nr:chemotaxis protein CheX [Pseudothermotoga thermarum]AEH50374.1 CheC domain protein [Pseudothermotoga thermarum DSM 5069]
MDVRVINALLNAIVSTFEFLLGVKPKVGRPNVLKEIRPKYNLVTIIGFVGSAEGSLIYSFKPELALKVVSKMMGNTYETVDEFVMSAVGEIGNMIAGSMAVNLEKIGVKITISPPTVVAGKELKVTVEGFVVGLPVGVFEEEDSEIVISSKGSILIMPKHE